MHSYEETLDFLAQAVGILSECQTELGVLTTAAETKKIILKSMGYPAETQAEAMASLQKLREEDFRRAMQPISVERKSRKYADLYVVMPSVTPFDAVLHLDLTTESGTTRAYDIPYEQTRDGEREEIDGTVMEQRWFTIELPDEYGYHTLTASGVDGIPDGAEMILAVVPDQCYRPDFITRENRPWGFPAQLYALTSKNSWGIGDFSTLKALMKTAGKTGASLVGINPVNTLFNASALGISPYYSTSRLFLNDLYIGIEDVDGYKECAALQKWVKSAAFKKQLAAVRASGTVDYPAVSAIKQKALRMLFDDFKAKEMLPKTDVYAAFKAFCVERGDDLYHLALYQALTAKMEAEQAAKEREAKEKAAKAAKSKTAKTKSAKSASEAQAAEKPAPDWRKTYADCDGDAAEEFAEENSDDILYYMYVQWLAAKQFKEAADSAQKAGLDIGLYQDLAVGVATQSAETWAHPDLFLKRLSVGSPPDMFSATGQKWGLAAMNPRRMRQDGYAFYRRILSENMKTAGALRIDHVMGLARLYLIPDGMTGAYLKYPFEELTGIVALESHRHKCMVIGEDLGVVPSFFRESMAQAGMLSFRIFRYQRGDRGAFLPPESYPEIALTAAGTHDMPTLCGFWTGEDIDRGEKMGVIADPQAARAARLDERRDMVWSFAKSGRWFVDSDNFDAEIAGEQIPEKLTQTVYRHLASTPSMLFLAQLEDILNQKEQMNFPGTVDQYPNWQYKLSVPVEELADDPRMKSVCAVIRAERNGKK